MDRNRGKECLQRYKEEDRVECGVDECGRGCLAGPVVAGAVIWPCDGVEGEEHIRDSKKLSPAKRKELAAFIQQHAIAWNVAFIDNKTIDDINILHATHVAMHKCLDGIQYPIDCILVDGNTFRQYKNTDGEDVKHECIVKGDDNFVSIAAASIIAKVARDEYMISLAEEENRYDWQHNVGYGTMAHRSAIRKHGLTDYHRTTFCTSFI